MFWISSIMSFIMFRKFFIDYELVIQQVFFIFGLTIVRFSGCRLTYWLYFVPLYFNLIISFLSIYNIFRRNRKLHGVSIIFRVERWLFGFALQSTFFIFNRVYCSSFNFHKFTIWYLNLLDLLNFLIIIHRYYWNDIWGRVVIIIGF